MTGGANICGRCRKPAGPAPEGCWWCGGNLCGDCWDKYGHCGHSDVEARSASARETRQQRALDEQKRAVLARLGMFKAMLKENEPIALELAMAEVDRLQAELTRVQHMFDRCFDSQQELVKERTALMLGMELAWGVIANAGEGNWERESSGWRWAAENWRDNHWHKALERNGNP